MVEQSHNFDFPLDFGSNAKDLWSDPRSNHTAGNIVVQTEKPFYMPGEWINGKVYIKANQDIMCEELMIEIRGKEKCKFTTMEFKGHGDDRKLEKEKHKKDRTFIHHNEMLANFGNTVVGKGEYECMFAF